MIGTRHALHCCFCGKKSAEVHHGDGKRKVRWCEVCARKSAYTCIDCSMRSRTFDTDGLAVPGPEAAR